METRRGPRYTDWDIVNRTHLEYVFESLIDRAIQHPGDTELVDVEARGVAIVEDLGVAEAVGGGAVEAFVAVEAGEKGFVQL